MLVSGHLTDTELMPEGGSSNTRVFSVGHTTAFLPWGTHQTAHPHYAWGHFKQRNHQQKGQKRGTKQGASRALA